MPLMQWLPQQENDLIFLLINSLNFHYLDEKNETDLMMFTPLSSEHRQVWQLL